MTVKDSKVVHRDPRVYRHAITTNTLQGRRSVGCLPIKFKQTTTVRFGEGVTNGHVITFQAEEVVNYLIVMDFDDLSAILKLPDGKAAYGVPKDRFVASPNF